MRIFLQKISYLPLASVIKDFHTSEGLSQKWYQICICQILEYVWLFSDDIISCQLQLGLKISWYYLGLIRILKILSSCHDILLLWKLANSKTTNKTKQTIMNFAGEMWHSKDNQRVFYTPPFSSFPLLDYDPRMSLALFWGIGDNFPLEGVLDSLCLQNCGNITLLLFYRPILK